MFHHSRKAAGDVSEVPCIGNCLLCDVRDQSRGSFLRWYFVRVAGRAFLHCGRRLVVATLRQLLASLCHIGRGGVNREGMLSVSLMSAGDMGATWGQHLSGSGSYQDNCAQYLPHSGATVGGTATSRVGDRCENDKEDADGSGERAGHAGPGW